MLASRLCSGTEVIFKEVVFEVEIVVILEEMIVGIEIEKTGGL